MRELCLPGRVYSVQPPLDTHCFNGGLVEAWGKLLAVYRVNQRPCMLALSELRHGGAGEWPLCGTTKLLWDLCDPLLMPEDPRVIYDPQKRELLVMHAGVHALDLSQSTICAAGIDADYNVTWKSPCWYDHARQCEKNWLPFLVNGRLHCIYEFSPFTVLSFQSGAWRLCHAREVAWRWAYGEIRGGAPPVWHEDRWYCFFHSSRMESGIKVYYAGCLTFDGNWEPMEITNEPVLAGSRRTTSRPVWTDRGISAVFPCGAVLSGDHWLLSYGYLDEDLRIASFSMSDLDATFGGGAT